MGCDPTGIRADPCYGRMWRVGELGAGRPKLHAGEDAGAPHTAFTLTVGGVNSNER